MSRTSSDFSLPVLNLEYTNLPTNSTKPIALIPSYNSNTDFVMQKIDNENLFKLLDNKRESSMWKILPASVAPQDPDTEEAKDAKEMLLLSKMLNLLHQMENIQSYYLQDLEPSLKSLIEQMLSNESVLDNEMWNANVICSHQWSEDVNHAILKALTELEHLEPSRAPQGGLSTEENVEEVSSSGTASASPEVLTKELICKHCEGVETPEWRNGPLGKSTLCNACGLFFSKLVKGYNEKIATYLLSVRKRDGLSKDRRVPQSLEFKGVFHTKRKGTSSK